jgi:prepilin-type N-terminal cleavage/methylation domain-containing protein
MMKKSGFTMMEVVMVIVIIALLATFAVPRLSQSQEAARLGEGVQILKTFRGAQERYNLDHSRYADDCDLLDVVLTPTNFDTLTCANDGSVTIRRIGGAYTVSVTAANAYSCTGTCAASPYLLRYLP